MPPTSAPSDQRAAKEQPVHAARDPLPCSFAPAVRCPSSPSSAAPVPNQFLTVYSSTQSPMSVKGQVDRMLNACYPSQSWDSTVIVPQLGGGFGGKTVQSSFCAVAAAFCAAKMQAPVRMVLARDTDMRVIGGRHPMSARFQAAADAQSGQLLALQLDIDSDCGATYDCTFVVADFAILTADNAYMVPQLVANIQPWFTNKASSTAFRSFGVIQSSHFTEYAMERLAEVISNGMNAYTLRAANFYPYAETNFPVTPYGQEVKYAGMDSVWAELDLLLADTVMLPRFDGVRAAVQARLGEAACFTPEVARHQSLLPKHRSRIATPGQNYAALQEMIDAANEASAFIKMGLAVLPVKYGISYANVKVRTTAARMRCSCPDLEPHARLTLLSRCVLSHFLCAVVESR